MTMTNPRPQSSSPQAREAARPKSSREVAETVWRRMDARIKDPRDIWGIPYGFKGLDTLTGGIHKEQMVILVARPSVGKTQMMVQIADHIDHYLQSDEGMADHPDGVVKLVLCEGTAETFYRRWACLRAEVSQRRVLDGSIRRWPQKVKAFTDALSEIAKRPIEVLDSAQSLDQIVAFLTSGNTVWWALDYAQKCPLAPHKPNDGSVGPITLISGALTEVARSKAPGLVLAHTPREVDKREDKRPRLGDIKGGSAFEGDARVVLGLYRESIYEHVPDDAVSQAQQAELLILKNNEGESGRSVPMYFYPRRGLFQDTSQFVLADEEDE